MSETGKHVNLGIDIKTILPSYLCILSTSKFNIFLTAPTIKESTVSSVSVNPLSSAAKKSSKDTVIKNQNYDSYVEGHSGCLKQNTSGHTQLNSLCEEEAGGKIPIINRIMFCIRVENNEPLRQCVTRIIFPLRILPVPSSIQCGP